MRTTDSEGLKAPYKPVGTSYWGGTRSRLSVFVRLLLAIALVTGAVFALKHYGHWEWLLASTNAQIALGVYALACAALRTRPFNPDRAPVRFTMDHSLGQIELVFMPGHFLLDTAWDLILLVRYAGGCPDSCGKCARHSSAVLVR